jgi:hypothetical protein
MEVFGPSTFRLFITFRFPYLLHNSPFSDSLPLERNKRNELKTKFKFVNIRKQGLAEDRQTSPVLALEPHCPSM